MAYESARISEIVERAENHTWSIPEFQRGFVWKPSQVRDLADSLWQAYPVGHLLIWDSKHRPDEEGPSFLPHLWIVDGQQRTTALSILFGKRPRWWTAEDDWARLTEKYDVRFDVAATAAPYFCVATSSIKRDDSKRFVPLAQLLTLDTGKPAHQVLLQTLAQEILSEGLCSDEDALSIYTKLDRVRSIRDREVVLVTMEHELEDVVEVFARLNSRGTKVTEADIYLGVVSARIPGWIRGTFLPFLERLSYFGYSVTPSLLFRTMTAVGVGKVRFAEIPDDFWREASISGSWERTQNAWRRLISQLRNYGVASRELLPSDAALVVMVSLLDRFPDSQFGKAFYWLLQAERFGRYGGSATKSLESDLRDIGESATLEEAVDKILRHCPNHGLPLLTDDFLRDHSESKFGRLLLYLLLHQNYQNEWPEGSHTVGFRDLEFKMDFRPEWHHIFPRKSLDGKFENDLIDALANFAVTGPALDVEVIQRGAHDSVSHLRFSEERLKEQFISSDIASIPVESYGTWVTERATVLAWAANNLIAELREGVPDIYHSLEPESSALKSQSLNLVMTEREPAETPPRSLSMGKLFGAIHLHR